MAAVQKPHPAVEYDDNCDIDGHLDPDGHPTTSPRTRNRALSQTSTEISSARVAGTAASDPDTDLLGAPPLTHTAGGDSHQRDQPASTATAIFKNGGEARRVMSTTSDKPYSAFSRGMKWFIVSLVGIAAICESGKCSPYRTASPCV